MRHEAPLLGAILLDPDVLCRVSSLIEPDDFISEPARLIYQAMLALSEKGDPIDEITVAQCLQEAEHLDIVGGAGHITGLAALVPTADNAEHYAKALSREGTKRRTAKIADDLVRQLAQPGIDPEMIISQVRDQLSAQGAKGDTWVQTGDILRSALHQYERIAQGDTHSSGVPTGWPALDAITKGLVPGHLVYLAGRPSMGKTACALEILRSVAKAGHHVAMISLEMSLIELAQRLISIESGVSDEAFRSAQATRDEWGRVTRACRDLAELPMSWWSPRRSCTVADVATRVRQLKRVKPSVIVLDYIGLLYMPLGRAQGRQDAVGATSRQLKELAREADACMLVLSQMNRGVELRPDKTPRLADLRESGNLEQDADQVIFVHRPEVYSEEAPSGLAELHIAKNRHGQIGKVSLRFRAGRFIDDWGAATGSPREKRWCT